MLTDVYRISICAQPDTIWKMLPEWLDNRDMYIHKVDSMKVVERSADRIVRELSYHGTTFRETAYLDQNNSIIRHELQDHPLYQGRYSTAIIPASVQNPMAPVELRLNLELERRSFKVEKLVQMEGALATDIEKNLRILKRMAEEREHELEGRGQHLSEGITHR